MEHLSWSKSEKRLAREVFDRAAQQELSELISAFKELALSVETPEQFWSIRKRLERTEREFESKYDFRYSQLLFVFGTLLREGRIAEEDILGLSEEKRDYVLRIAGL